MCILLQFLFLQIQLLVDTVFRLCDAWNNIVLFAQQVYASPTAFRCVCCPFFGRTHKTVSYCAVPRASCCASCCLGDRFYRDSIILTNSNFALPKVQFLFGLPVPTDSSIWKSACHLFLTSINSSSGSSILHKEHFQYWSITKLLFIGFPPGFPLRDGPLTRLR